MMGLVEICGYRVRLFDPEEILTCVKDEHPDDPWHFTGTRQFQKTADGEFLVASVVLVRDES